MAAFFGSFLSYFIKAALFAAIAFVGVQTGRLLRDNKDSKSSTVRINSGRK